MYTNERLHVRSVLSDRLEYIFSIYEGHHSVVGRPSVGGLAFAEYVVYRGEQAYPEYLITYQVKPLN